MLQPIVRYKHLSDLVIFTILVGLSGFLTLYHLGHPSLFPWDEAWYATIARNLVRGGHWLDIQYNYEIYWDHPPLGFYLTAVSFAAFGINELTARLPQTLLAVATSVLVYFTGKTLKNRWVGVMVTLVVLSARWWLFRARSGNLDILLTFTQLAFFTSAYTTRWHRRLWLPALSLGMALMAKSVVSITLAPLLLLALWERHLLKPVRWQELALAGLVGVAPLLPWYGYNTWKYGLNFLWQNVFVTGLRQGTTRGVSLASLKLTLLYFHSAVHRWYSLGILSMVFGAGWSIYLATKKSWSQLRSWGWTLAYLVLAGFPYLLSVKTEIWHLIPLTVPVALLIGLAISVGCESIFPKLARSLGLLAILLIAISSWRNYWHEFLNLPFSTSEAAQLSQRMTNKKLSLYLTNDAFFPTIVYYADLDKRIRVIKEYEFSDICAISLEPFRFLTTAGFLQKTTGWTQLDQQGELIYVEFSNHTCGPKIWPQPRPTSGDFAPTNRVAIAN